MMATQGSEGGRGEKPVIAFLGPQASYTHQATLDTFDPDTYTLSPQITIEDVFAAVQSGTAYRGVVPFENSTNGSVVFTLDLFADLHNKYPDILVCGECYIAVQHCLLGHVQAQQQHATSTTTTFTGQPSSTEGGGGGLARLSNIIESPLSSGAATPTSHNPVPPKPTARPVGDLSRIKKIYSHPQAWGQCRVFLDTYLKGVERQDVSSTSRAAELVAADASGESAAISSLVAARIFGLGVLAKGIEERGDNTTRFFVVRRGGVSGGPAQEGKGEGTSAVRETSGEGTDDKAKWKTLVSFTVDHANPGALAHSLAVFERYGLNLTSINTRPSGVENWNYIFFVEINGRKSGEEAGKEEEEGDVNRALRDLDRVCRGWRWLGSWENRLVGR